MPELEHQGAVDAGRTAVGDRVFVTGPELHCEVEHLSRRHAAEEQRLAGEPGNRATAKTEVGHRDPGGELADRFSDETHGKARQVDGDRIAPYRTRTRFQRRDPIDERERTEPFGHQHLAPPVSPRLARRAVRARPPCRRFPA